MKLLKSRDQHILVDERYLRKIVSVADIKSDESVLEVGCGPGNLTRLLLRRAKKVVGIEKDSRFVELLKKKFSGYLESGRFEIVEGDALKVEFPDCDKFVSNIPFSISTPLTFKIFRHGFKLSVVTYQKEFAERLVAREGSKKYGRLSVIAKIYCQAEIVDVIPRRAFRPPPKVDAAIVKIVHEPEIEVENLEIFEDLVTFAFSRRRKKFSKILEEWCEKRNLKVSDMGYGDERPEKIPPEVFAEIADSVRTG